MRGSNHSIQIQIENGRSAASRPPRLSSRSHTSKSGIAAPRIAPEAHFEKLSGGGNEALSFSEELRQAIEREKDYPVLARSRKETGRVEVGFTLMKSGGIINVRVVKACTFSRLNDAALRTVMKLKQFRAVPDSISKTDWNVVVPILFKLDGV